MVESKRQGLASRGSLLDAGGGAFRSIPGSSADWKPTAIGTLSSFAVVRFTASVFKIQAVRALHMKKGHYLES
jgi:hypothetical protein